jgi:hypothetical protein
MREVGQHNNPKPGDDSYYDDLRRVYFHEDDGEGDGDGDGECEEGEEESMDSSLAANSRTPDPSSVGPGGLDDEEDGENDEEMMGCGDDDDDGVVGSNVVASVVVEAELGDDDGEDRSEKEDE